jgi:hypothetical protein
MFRFKYRWAELAKRAAGCLVSELILKRAPLSSLALDWPCVPDHNTY